MMNPQITIRRLDRNHLPKEETEGTIIADIGYGKYDHHQADAFVDDRGHKYAAIGLVLRDYKDLIYPEGVPGDLVQIVHDIEDIDNGVSVPEDRIGACISKIVESYLPAWYEQQLPEILDTRFLQAMNFVKENVFIPFQQSLTMPEANKQALYDRYDYYLDRKEKADSLAKKAIIKAYAESRDNIVVLSQSMPWEELLADTEAKYVIYPSNRGGYNLQCVPLPGDLFSQKQPLPEEWLRELPDGCIFVHTARFLAAFETEDTAYNAAKKLIGE